MSATIEFHRRLGPGNETLCVGCQKCPDIWELADGDFAIIGKDITAIAEPLLPAIAGCGPDERIVRLPRKLLVNAKRDIPDSV